MGFPAEMRTENLAVMLTDMKGFTAATSRQSRAENERMLAVQDELVLPVVRAFGGRRVKTIGDAYLVLFRSPTAALLCGMAVQDRLWDYGRRVAKEERIEVRIVLSLGEVRLVGAGAVPSDVYGEAVNLAARVEAEAEAGEVWFTEAVRLVADRGQVGAEEIGTRRLKGIDEEVRLYRVPYASHRGDRPPYGNVGLARVLGVAPPEPERLERAIRRRANPLFRAGAAVAGLAAAVPLRAATAALLLAASAAGAWVWSLGGTERLIARGEWDAAKAEIDARAAARGDADPRVLYLRGRLEATRVDAGEGGSLRHAFALWSRGVSAGSGDALGALEEAARSWECERRRLAARALADSGSRDALAALRVLAEAEPPPADAVEKVKHFLRADGSCGDGDVARRGIEEIEGAGR
ncbi:MAG TPA: adenylate/guanylate cyclase domain-containing protein [Anaeromyxobacter sp.]|nr:adenylate/guanylate cyclase domain-containing protein [Anaeromyxobacter sp.]